MKQLINLPWTKSWNSFGFKVYERFWVKLILINKILLRCLLGESRCSDGEKRKYQEIMKHRRHSVMMSSSVWIFQCGFHLSKKHRSSRTDARACEVDAVLNTTCCLLGEKRKSLTCCSPWIVHLRTDNVTGLQFEPTKPLQNHHCCPNLKHLSFNIQRGDWLCPYFLSWHTLASNRDADTAASSWG